MILALQIIICVTLVVFVGRRLSQSADILAEKTGLGRSWVGAILLAGATSLPELATGTSAVIGLNAPDLAVGGIFGSCLFNLLILALLDGVSGEQPLFPQIHISHGLAASMSVILLGTAAAGLLMSQGGTTLQIGWIGLPSLLILGIYMLSTQLIASYENRPRSDVPEHLVALSQYHHITRKQAYIRFGLLALAIVLLGIWLAWLGDQVAEATGLGESFIGALLLAAATSLPEVIASLEAVRLKALDLAVANIFGSNIFNLTILAIYDLVYLPGNLWFRMNAVYAFTATITMIMTTVAIVGMIYRTDRRSRFYLSWIGITLIGLYLLGMYVIYRT